MQEIVIRSTGTPYVTRIRTRSHEWLADEPTESDGQDEAATPFEQFVGAIGSCSVITAQMYARRKGWPLEEIEIEIGYRRINAADCPDCETEKGKIAEFTMQIQMKGELSPDQRDRLLDIIGRCPVKRAVEGEVKFRMSME